MKNNTWVFGDVHAEYNKFKGLIAKLNLKDGDKLISLGDLVDRGPDSFKVIEYCLELSKKYKCVFLRGNHDACFRDSVATGLSNVLYNQGGRETMLSYTRDTECGGDPCKIPFEHINFFLNEQRNYYVDENNNLFVHGGFNRHEPIEDQHEDVLLWDRDLFLAALSFKAMKRPDLKFKTKGNYNKIFIGHTPTVHWGSTQPITAANVTNLDTGCGKGAFPLSAMNLETEEIVQFLEN